MGLFDFLDDAIDAAINLPGAVIEKTVETVARIPEVGTKAIEGLVTGAETGIEKVSEAIDKALE